MAIQINKDIKYNIDNKKSFVLMGGAGSGKTYSLIQTIDYIAFLESNIEICCITFTNAAVDEIKRRCSYKNLKVGTIHDILWDFIKPYKKNLLVCFQELVDSNKFNLVGKNLELIKNIKNIEYKDYTKLEEGVFSHDELLLIADKMFEKYEVLYKIFSDKYKYFLIDEYQDTFDVIIRLIIKLSNSYLTVVGCYGDSMQAIYENYTLSEPLHFLLENNNFAIIKKDDNFRCSKQVISLINNLRDDNVHQEPVNNNLEGNIKFIYGTNKSLSLIQSNDLFSNFDWKSINTKQLLLTHNLISKELGFDNFLQAVTKPATNFDKRNSYALGKENERHYFINSLFKISEILLNYENLNIKKLLDRIDYKIKEHSDKERIRVFLDETSHDLEKDCFTMYKKFVEAKLLKDVEIEASENDYDKALLEALKKVSFTEALSTYNYTEGLSPFSTQHNIKGLEFNNVFVYLDNGRWNKYNFTRLFENDKGNMNIFSRTLKLFYVCCSRSKDNLFIYFPNPSIKVIDQAKEWFGENNVVNID